MICIQCGNCCKYVYFPTSPEFAAAKDWLNVRGIEEDRGYLKVAMICPKLAGNKCSIQDTKPECCKAWEPGCDPICPLYQTEGEKGMGTKSFEQMVKEYKEASGKGPVKGNKQFSIEDFKASKDDSGNVIIEGYANTKNSEDRYGDVPTVFSALRNYVYELDDYHKNPVVLIDHYNSVENIAGSCNPKMGGYCMEDERGLKFKMIFSNSDFPPVAHARTVYAEGHGRALSIGGEWFHEDKDNPNNLTYAKIYEFSLVGVGADPEALTTKNISSPDNTGKETARNPQETEESITAAQVSGKGEEVLIELKDPELVDVEI